MGPAIPISAWSTQAQCQASTVSAPPTPCMPQKLGQNRRLLPRGGNVMSAPTVGGEFQDWKVSPGRHVALGTGLGERPSGTALRATTKPFTAGNTHVRRFRDPRGPPFQPPRFTHYIAAICLGTVSGGLIVEDNHGSS